MISARAKALRLIVMLVGLGHGLIYVFLMPPWQHYDEPTHFEYSWLIAYKQRIPIEGQSDIVLSRAVMESMTRHRFYSPWPGPNVSLLSDAEVYLGYSQLGDPPAYYLLAAPAIAMLHGNAVEVQLYGARMVSFALLAITLAATSKIAQVTHAHDGQLQLLAPLTLGLIPAFVDAMTACNNTVGAVAAGSLLLLAMARLLIHGPSARRIGALITAGVLCAITASISLLMAAVIPVVLLFSILGVRRFQTAIVVLAAIGLVVVAGLVGWGDVAYWYRGSQQRSSLQSVDSSGNAWLLLEQSEGQPPARALQLLSDETVAALAGKQVQLSGRWRADRAIELQPPRLADLSGEVDVRKKVPVSIDASAFAFDITLPITFVRGWVSIDPGLDPGARVWLDELELIRVGETPARNYLRNSGFDMVWPRLRIWETPWRNRLIWGLDEYNLLLSPLDTQVTEWLFVASGLKIFATMWTHLGWAHVGPPQVLLFVCLMLMVFSLLGHLHARRNTSPAWLICASLCAIALVSFTLLRGLQSLIYPPYLPVARYFFPVMPLIAIWMTGGWQKWSGRGRVIPVAAVLSLVLVAFATLLFVQSFYLAR